MILAFAVTPLFAPQRLLQSPLATTLRVKSSTSFIHSVVMRTGRAKERESVQLRRGQRQHDNEDDPDFIPDGDDSTPLSSTRPSSSSSSSSSSSLSTTVRRTRKRKRHDVSPSPLPSLPPTNGRNQRNDHQVPDIEDLNAFVKAPFHSDCHRIISLLSNHFNWSIEKFISSRPQHRPVLDMLVRTVLSQATTDTNSGRAFRSLKSTFPTWELALHEGCQHDGEKIESAIRVAGLAESKTKTIMNILYTLRDERGEHNINMEYVKDIQNDIEAHRELTRFKGVGEKTASCVLMFGLRRPMLPVDTHIRRVCGRLGWTKSKTTPDATAKILDECTPKNWECRLSLHMLLIQLGKHICKARATQCETCPLRFDCLTGKTKLANKNQQVRVKKEENVENGKVPCRIRIAKRREKEETEAKIKKEQVVKLKEKRKKPKVKKEEEEEG